MMLLRYWFVLETVGIIIIFAFVLVWARKRTVR